MSRYQFIEQAADTEPVQVLCRVLHVSSAGHYQWLRRADRPTDTYVGACGQYDGLVEQERIR